MNAVTNKTFMTLVFFLVKFDKIKIENILDALITEGLKPLMSAKVQTDSSALAVINSLSNI